MSVYRGSQGQPGSPSLRYQKTHINPNGDLPGGETGPQGSRLTGSSISSSSWGAVKRTSKRKFSDTTDTYVKMTSLSLRDSTGVRVAEDLSELRGGHQGRPVGRVGGKIFHTPCSVSEFKMIPIFPK